jgi:uncharacterized protein
MKRFPLRRLRLRSGEQHREEAAIELEPFELGGQTYLPVPHDPPASLAVSRTTSGLVLELAFGARLHGPCMRCLEDAVVLVAVDAREYHADAPGEDESLRSEYVVDDQLELAVWARDAVALGLPEQVLCRPECAGLCPVCGKNLNHEPHEHESDRSDPRWQALEELRLDG